LYILSAGTELARLPLAELDLRSPWLDTEEVRRPFLCWSSKSCGELRLSLDLALDAKDELVDVTFAYNDDEFGGAVRGRGGRGEDWALLSGCNEESPAIFRRPLRLFGKGGRPEREKLMFLGLGLLQLALPL